MKIFFIIEPILIIFNNCYYLTSSANNKFCSIMFSEIIECQVSPLNREKCEKENCCYYEKGESWNKEKKCFILHV